VVWRDKRQVCLLKNIQDSPTESNYCDVHGNAIKPAIVADYNRHMGHADNSDRMANSYTASRRTWKWKKAPFPLVGPDHYQKSHSSLFISWEEISHRGFRLTLIRELLARVRHEPRSSMPVGRPSAASTTIGRLDTTHKKHGLPEITQKTDVACVQRGA
jgi:hypothetical protein